MVAEHRWSSKLQQCSKRCKRFARWLAQQQQRHAQEIQRLQDKIMTTKPSCWDTMNNFKNFKLFSGDSKERDEFPTKFRSQVAAGDGGVA